jgi:hypothetical protein
MIELHLAKVVCHHALCHTLEISAPTSSVAEPFWSVSVAGSMSENGND